MKITTKKFIGGCVCGLLAGALIGGYTVAVIAGSAFIVSIKKRSRLL